MNKIIALDTYKHINPLVECCDEENTAALDLLEKRIQSIEKENPAKFSVPEEREKLLRGAGKGLELTAIINLQTESLPRICCIGKNYSLDLSIPCNDGAKHYSFHDNYKSVERLARGAKELIADAEIPCHGAKINPIFYTITKEKLKGKEEDIELIKNTYDTPDAREALKHEPLIYRIAFKLKFKSTLWLMRKVTMKGLTDKEVAQFEKLYSEREDKE